MNPFWNCQIWTVSSFCRQTRQIRVWEVVCYKRMEEWSTQCFMQVKSSSPGNRYYSVGEREALAIIWAVKNFHSYLYGQHFTLESDLRPLEYLQTSRSQNPRIMRWSLALQPYRSLYCEVYTRVRKRGCRLPQSFKLRSINQSINGISIAPPTKHGWRRLTM